MQRQTKLFWIAIVCVTATVFAAQQPAANPVAAGEALFFGKAGCSGCHEVNGRGGTAGPDLSAAGTKSADDL